MSARDERAADPHAGRPVHTAGAPLAEARLAVIMLHGRGGSAPDILGLAGALRSGATAFLAPQAAGNSWYPYRFLEPAAANEPHLGSALSAVAGLLGRIREAGVPEERVVLLGFSQGACLASEFAVRHPRRYGGVVALSGGLIGTDAETGPRAGDLAGTPVFMGCSDVDPHIPLARVEASAATLTAMGADVEARIYPGMGHGIAEDEVVRVRALLERAGA